MVRHDIVRSDGEVRHCVARGAPVDVADDGTVLTLMGTMQDITDLVRAQRERDRVVERMELAVRATHVGVWEWDLDRDELFWDATMRELHGLPPDEQPTFQAWVDSLHPDDVESATAAVTRSLEERSHLDSQFRIRTPDGGWRVIRGHGDVFCDADGVPRRMIGSNTDVTAEWSNTKLLEEQKRLLEQSNEELDAFAYNASHDLQEPLRAVAMGGQLLLDHLGDDADDDTRQLVGVMVDGVSRMHDLVHGLLAFARAGAEPALAPTPLEGIVAGALEDVAALVAETEADIRVEPLPSVRVDPGLLRLVFAHLLTNALKYSERRPRVAIRALADEPGHIVVADNGPGTTCPTCSSSSAATWSSWIRAT